MIRPTGSLAGTILLIVSSAVMNCRPDTSRLVLDGAAASMIDPFVESIHIDTIGGIRPAVSTEVIADGIARVRITFELADTVRQPDWQVRIRPGFSPTFHWAPHLTPTDDHIIAQHVFRAPAIIVADSGRQLTIIPDLDLIDKNSSWYMDLDAPRNLITLGSSKSKVTEHVLFQRDTGAVFVPFKFEFGFFVITTTAKEELANPWRKVLSFSWDRWGHGLYDKGEPIDRGLEPYVDHTYRWAFDTWKDQVWQEFALFGKRVGAPVFIVNVTQSPNYPGPVNEREFRSVWNQAWFSSLRSAQGLYRYARRHNNKELLDKARMTKELALLFPQQDGLFPSVIGTKMERVEVSGKTVSRSSGWNQYFFGNSNRNPEHPWQGADIAPCHILDMSWTSWLMLTWYMELEKDERLIAYARRYGDRLLTLQDARGFFPAWLDTRTLKPLPYLNDSPETSMSVTFLLALHQVTHDDRYKDAALKAMDAVIDHVIPQRRWEDYETYWSCSRVLDTLVGKKVQRNNTFKQNTLSMFWTSEALLHCYKLTANRRYLELGQRTLDELLMYQATWQPPFIPIHALGGFGVMNGDGEWNDSRQSLFAELILQYGKELSQAEYTERGLSALRSSFVMMYCPENPETMEQWTKVYPFFNEKDYGFMMENYGHGGETNSEGLGIGEFTIYDWGNGAAAEAYGRIVDHFGEPFTDGANSNR